MQHVQNLARGLGQRTLERATAGALVPAPAKALGHSSHIKLAFAAQAYPKRPPGSWRKNAATSTSPIEST